MPERWPVMDEESAGRAGRGTFASRGASPAPGRPAVPRLAARTEAARACSGRATVLGAAVLGAASLGAASLGTAGPPGAGKAPRLTKAPRTAGAAGSSSMTSRRCGMGLSSAHGFAGQAGRAQSSQLIACDIGVTPHLGFHSAALCGLDIHRGSLGRRKWRRYPAGCRP